MKRLLAAILAVIAIAGCKTADGPLHDWKPPGMLMQLQGENGMTVAAATGSPSR